MKHEDVHCSATSQSLCASSHTHTDTRQHFSPETDPRVSFFTIRGHQAPRRNDVLILAKFSFFFFFFSFVRSISSAKGVANFSAIFSSRLSLYLRIFDETKVETLCRVFSPTVRQLIKQEERSPITEAGLTGRSRSERQQQPAEAAIDEHRAIRATFRDTGRKGESNRGSPHGISDVAIGCRP